MTINNHIRGRAWLGKAKQGSYPSQKREIILQAWQGLARLGKARQSEGVTLLQKGKYSFSLRNI